MKKSFHLPSQMFRRAYQLMLLCALALAAQTGFATITYYVAPTAQGTGDGSSAANAASYTSATLWGNVQGSLATDAVEVYLLNGTYPTELDLTHKGDPVNRLSIEAQNYGSATFNSSADTFIKIVGSQNIKIGGITFSGSAGSWAINCYPDGRIPAKNILIQSCTFQNLTSITYGGIGIQIGARDITVDHCTFSNVGTVDTAHAIYVSHDVVGVIVSNCSFTDTAADYVRFRDDCEYCTVTHCTFHSTKSSTCFAFIRVPMFNPSNPGTDPNTDPNCDYFGTYFQVDNNSFTYDVSAGTRAALQFSCDDWQPRGLHTALTSTEASELDDSSSETTTWRRNFLSSNMAITWSGIKMFSNTYNNVSDHVAYSFNPGDGYSGNGWSGTVNMSDVPDSSGATLASSPGIRNGTFAAAGYHMRDWTYSSTILWHPGIDGTVGAARLGYTNYNQSIYQWMPNLGTTWTLDFDFLVGSDFQGTGVKFRVDVLNNEYTGTGLSLGVDNTGMIGVYNGGTLVDLGLPHIAFSQDNNGNGYYNDSGDVMNWYHVQLVGNYAYTPSVDVYCSDANSTTLTHHGTTDYTNWLSTPPVSGVTVPSSVTFKNYSAKAVVDGVSWNGRYWHSWDNPGGGIPDTGLTFTTAFAAASWGANRIDVFGIGSDNQMYHTYWAGSGWLSPWELHTLPVAPAGGPGASANNTVANRLDDYFIGTDGNCYHQDWTPSTGWTAWENLGAPSGTSLVGTPSATSWGSGRYDVYCQDANHHVYRKYYSGGSWSSWISQGGTILGDPSSCTWAANRLDAFVIGTDSKIYHQYWNGSSFVPSQTGWQLDSGLPQTISPLYGLGASSWGSGRIDLFANTGSTIAHNWFSSSWHADWNDTVTPTVTPVSAPTAASWGLNRIDLFVLGLDGQCYHNYYSSP